MLSLRLRRSPSGRAGPGGPPRGPPSPRRLGSARAGGGTDGSTGRCTCMNGISARMRPSGYCQEGKHRTGISDLQMGLLGHQPRAAFLVDVPSWATRGHLRPMARSHHGSVPTHRPESHHLGFSLEAGRPLHRSRDGLRHLHSPHVPLRLKLRAHVARRLGRRGDPPVPGRQGRAGPGGPPRRPAPARRSGFARAGGGPDGLAGGPEAAAGGGHGTLEG